ncbi:T9SS type A sorting domain-containing protein [Flavobacteriaceae bacterium TK19130]|nr:T9SS type A sorting domain-containing protein [Thermobacterium salinum]
MKYIFGIFLFAMSLSVASQNFEDSWTGHFSYNSVRSITQGDDRVYAASENAIFSYDLSTQEIETFSSVTGLAGETISTIYYSSNFDLLLVGYESGLMQVIVEGEEDVLNVVDILEKQNIPPDKKLINHFYENEDIVYISTDYGISEYNLATLEFGDTFFIGPLGTQIEIAQSTINPPFIYAASKSQGIFQASTIDVDLIDYQNWTNPIGGGFVGIQTVGTQVYAARNNSDVIRVASQGTATTVGNVGSPIQDFTATNSLLTITTATNIRSYSDDFSLQASVFNIPEFDYQLQSGIAFDGFFYTGTETLGLFIIPFGSNQPEQILPNGPLFNRGFTIDASPGQLWLAYGEVTVSFNPAPFTRRGISNLREGEWTNISYEELIESVGNRPVTDIVNIAINPNNSNETFMTSYQYGLLQIEDQTPINLFDDTNSPLEEVFVGGDNAGIRLYGLTFDDQGNLWTVQSRTDEGLIRRTPEGQFQIFDIEQINPTDNQALTEIAISREGYVFMATNANGLSAFNPSNNTFNTIGEGEGQGNLPSSDVRALAFDNNNRLWIGTLEGLRVLFNVGGFFEEDADVEAQAIIILEGDVAQELLFQQSITDIEVDGSNNKWISTATSGVFYLSSNGQETLLRFTEDNSPLPSNNVQDIAIDDFTGTVYFATTNGLVAYNGTSTAPRENLENVYAFPNPVRPNYEGNVTIDGLMANSNVKITDIEGNLVFEETSEGGSILWDTTAFGRYKVRSGVYLVMVTSEDAFETTVAKIMIVR